MVSCFGFPFLGFSQQYCFLDSNWPFCCPAGRELPPKKTQKFFFKTGFRFLWSFRPSTVRHAIICYQNYHFHQVELPPQISGEETHFSFLLCGHNYFSSRISHPTRAAAVKSPTKPPEVIRRDNASPHTQSLCVYLRPVISIININ